MKLSQNDLERIKDRMAKGELNAAQANVEKVRMQRVMLVIGSLPMMVRKQLNDAVKAGELGHMKKDGKKPEAFYHPAFEYLAKGERADHKRNVETALINFARACSGASTSEE